MNNAGEHIVDFNGTPTKVRDLKGANNRAMFGYGHFPEDIQHRDIVPTNLLSIPDHTYLYTPETCSTDDYRFNNIWTTDNTLLACRGCGLDVT